jgi:hypothetical protein
VTQSHHRSLLIRNLQRQKILILLLQQEVQKHPHHLIRREEKMI